MGERLIEDTDIYTCPPPDKVNHYEGSLTLGDLHGNALKLLYFLLRYKIIDFKDGIQEENYQKFVDVYEQSSNQTLSKQELSDMVDSFHAILANIRVINKDVLIRLIGDEVADRGNNDYFTLKLLDLLTKNDVRLHITLSNHGNAFIAAYQSGEFTTNGMMNSDQARSFTGLKQLVDSKVIRLEDVKALVDDCYMPALKLLDYELDDKAITLFTHAPVEFNLIKTLADKYKVTYRDTSTHELAATIDNINNKFAAGLKRDDFIGHIKAKHVRNVTSLTPEQTKAYPLLKITWNRLDNIRDRHTPRPRSMHNEAYFVNYVHGHDSYKSAQPHVINLDTPCGKMSRQVFETMNEQEKKNALLSVVFEANNQLTNDYSHAIPQQVPISQQRLRDNAILATERLKRFMTLFTLGGMMLGTAIGVTLVASGALAAFGIGLLTAIAASAIIGCGLAFVGTFVGLTVAKMTEPKSLDSEFDYQKPPFFQGGPKAMAQLGRAIPAIDDRPPSANVTPKTVQSYKTPDATETESFIASSGP